MKHTLKITLLLAVLFLLAQIIGLQIVKGYLEIKEIRVGNQTVVQKEWQALPYNVERPRLEEETSYLPIFLTILAATIVLIVIIRLGLLKLWKFWFFLSVWACLMIAFGAFIHQRLALIIAFILAVAKTLRYSLVLHNLTELFIYGGLAAIFTPVFSLWSISILLILISVYDFIAVLKTKHMVKMAKFQAKLKLFAGLMIPYGDGRTAILGGGDIGFPLIFSAVLMKDYGNSAFIVPLFTSLALLYLLIKGEKNKFYPAMPYISAGCFIGYLILLLVNIV